MPAGHQPQQGRRRLLDLDRDVLRDVDRDELEATVLRYLAEGM